MTSLPYVSCHCDSFDAFDSFSFTSTRLITRRPGCHFSFYNFHPCDCECWLVALLYIYVVLKCSWTVKIQVTLIDGYTRHHRSIEKGRINRGVVWRARPAQYSHIYSTCVRTACVSFGHIHCEPVYRQLYNYNIMYEHGCITIITLLLHTRSGPY